MVNLIADFSLNDLLAILWIVGIPAITLIIIFIVRKYRDKSRKSDVACSKCGTPYINDGSVNWKIISRKHTDTKVINKVHFDCICGHCGARKVFLHDFTAAYIDSNGDIVSEPIEEIINNYFS